ncbi:MAG: hypothetical protein COB94_008715 [Gammaproteobacteria bacterium]|nr:hypothetical protein [Gammaproteobacteria bacterium]
MRKVSFLLVSVLAGMPIAHAHNWDLGVPDSHAPMGVMGDHNHKVGELMLSYR